MESGDSLGLGSLVCSPTDEGLPFAPPASSPPLPPLLPNHTNRDLPPSAAALELQAWEFPASCSNPTGLELVLNHLVPEIDRLLWKTRLRKAPSRPAVVNAGLPVMNPWELPGMSLKEGRTEKYYLTDHIDLCFTSSCNLEAPDGFWKLISKRGLFKPTFPRPGFVGRRKTFEFHARADPSGVGIKTNWIMNVYALIYEDGFIEDDLVICHVFDSPDYNRRPECWTYLEAMDYDYGDILVSNKAQSNSSFLAPPFRPSPMHHGQDRHSDSRSLDSYMADLENLLFGDPDTSTDTDNYDPRGDIPPIPDDGQSRKRKKNRSVVWAYFTKIYARDRKGEVLTFAACNHCFKLLTGGSSGGTAHLARHRCSCPCKLQPVAAGGNAQRDVNVLSS